MLRCAYINVCVCVYREREICFCKEQHPLVLTACATAHREQSKLCAHGDHTPHPHIHGPPSLLARPRTQLDTPGCSRVSRTHAHTASILISPLHSSIPCAAHKRSSSSSSNSAASDVRSIHKRHRAELRTVCGECVYVYVCMCVEWPRHICTCGEVVWLIRLASQPAASVAEIEKL